MTVLPELHALVAAHERLAQALLRELGRADPARAERVAAELEAAAGEAHDRGGESSHDLARALEDYAVLLRNANAAAVPEARVAEPS